MLKLCHLPCCFLGHVQAHSWFKTFALFFSLPKILPDININIFVLVSRLHLNSFSQYCIPWPAYLRIQHIPLEMSYYSTFFGLISLDLTTTCPIIWVMYYFFFRFCLLTSLPREWRFCLFLFNLQSPLPKGIPAMQ